jgi:uncharacterized protein YkwD
MTFSGIRRYAYTMSTRRPEIPFALLSSALLAACTPDFNTVESACTERYPGRSNAADAADEIFYRINCYRRVAGLAKASISAPVQQAVSAHAHYMAEHEVYTDEEIPGKSGFTGEDALTRLAAAGLDLSTLPSVGAWIAISPKTEEMGTISDIIDEWVADPYQRQIVLQRGWRAAGFAVVGEYLYGNLIYDFPTASGGARPTLYPSDGQLYVPTTWTSPYAFTGVDDGIPDGEPLGFPISITVGSWQYVEDANPYDLELESATLEGPTGEVELYTVTPVSEAPVSLVSSIVLVPTEPLLAGANYRLEARVKWVDGTTTVKSVFRTDDEVENPGDTGL